MRYIVELYNAIKVVEKVSQPGAKAVATSLFEHEELKCRKTSCICHLHFPFLFPHRKFLPRTGLISLNV